MQTNPRRNNDCFTIIGTGRFYRTNAGQYTGVANSFHLIAIMHEMRGYSTSSSFLFFLGESLQSGHKLRPSYRFGSPVNSI
ncbi:hypothetical protein ACHAXS_011517 [Conticribra weissflogii]